MGNGAGKHFSRVGSSDQQRKRKDSSVAKRGKLTQGHTIQVKSRAPWGFSFGPAVPTLKENDPDVHQYLPPTFPVEFAITPSMSKMCRRAWTHVIEAKTQRMAELNKSTGKSGLVLFYDEFYLRLFSRAQVFMQIFNNMRTRGQVIVKATEFILLCKGQNEPDELKQIYKLGHAHRYKKGIRPWMFSMYSETFLETLMYSLGGEATAAMGEAWTNILGYVLVKILQAYCPKMIDREEIYQNTDVKAVRQLQSETCYTGGSVSLSHQGSRNSHSATRGESEQSKASSKANNSHTTGRGAQQKRSSSSNTLSEISEHGDESPLLPRKEAGGGGGRKGPPRGGGAAKLTPLEHLQRARAKLENADSEDPSEPDGEATSGGGGAGGGRRSDLSELSSLPSLSPPLPALKEAAGTLGEDGGEEETKEGREGGGLWGKGEEEARAAERSSAGIVVDNQQEGIMVDNQDKEEGRRLSTLSKKSVKFAAI